LPAYARFKDCVFLSIAAGIPLAKLESLLGSDTCAVVRSMPNLPASVGQGATAAIANRRVSPTQRALSDALLSAVGETVWIEDESLIDIITALNANGPAYVFALCEAMARAGVALGLPSDMAIKLARQTVIGSGAILAQSSESAEVLRAAVTSPGGTTEASLKHLCATSNGIAALLLKAMSAGVDRAKEFSI
jgi:pyrroline-5-carboxylate reductase